MKECKYFQQLLIEVFYDEIKPEEKSNLNDHLENCETCKTQSKNIKSTLIGMNNYRREEPSEEYWNNYWINLESKLDRKPKFNGKIKKLISSIQIKPYWIYGVATAAAFLIIGIILGKFYFTSQPTESFVATEITQKNIRTVATAERYLQRSKVLLLGIVNMDIEVETNYKPDISKQQQISRELIQQTAVLKNDLKETDQKIILELINELETILLQIANLEKEHDYDAIELIQKSLDRKGILVKINLGQILSGSNNQNIKPGEKSKKQI